MLDFATFPPSGENIPKFPNSGKNRAYSAYEEVNQKFTFLNILELLTQQLLNIIRSLLPSYGKRK